MVAPSRELLNQLSRPPPTLGRVASSSAEWTQAQTKLQTVFGRDQTTVDNAHKLVHATSARVHRLINGISASGSATERTVMRGYTGHVPGAREVVAAGYRGPSAGNAYRGPQFASAPYAPPSPPNKCAPGP